MNLNSSPSPFPIHQEIIYDNDHHYQPFPPNPNSLSCRIFFNSSQDQSGFYDPHQLMFHPQDDNYGYEVKRKVESGLKLTLWKKEDEGQNGNYPVKWMSSKMRVMQKMKNPGDQKLQPSSSDTSSNSSSYNNNNSNAPIRVCADCNTTKTPLWRSGPKGPKSLCNACGIRQRKARRAMAAAAASANGSADQIDQPPVMKIKVQQKEKTGKNGVQFKKRFKKGLSASGSASNGQKKIDFEDFLINISKNLAFQRVFPEDEKDAAILLMALSSGLVNG